MTEIILNMLKKELFNKDSVVAENFQWEDLWQEAQLQSVSTLVYSGATKLGIEDETSKKKSALQLLRNSNSFMNHIKIATILNNAGIDYLILKGVISASHYPDPYIRPMGDTDVLVKKEDFETAKNLFIENGLKTNKGDAVIDEQHHHIDFIFNKQRVELHYALPGIPKNIMTEKIHTLTDNVFEEAKYYDTIYGKIKGPADFHHGLIMLLHMQEHMQKGGMGLRHLCDWAVFVNSFTEEEFKNIFEEKLKSIGLWHFACLLSQTSSFLGLPQKQWMGNDGEVSEKLLEDIISCGNFGRKDIKRVESQKYVPVVGNKKKKKSQVGQYIDYGINTTMEIWPFYKKHKWLIPIGFTAYCIRTGYRLLTKKSKIYDLSENNKIYDLYSQLKLFEE